MLFDSIKYASPNRFTSCRKKKTNGSAHLPARNVWLGMCMQPRQSEARTDKMTPASKQGQGCDTREAMFTSRPGEGPTQPSQQRAQQYYIYIYTYIYIYIYMYIFFWHGETCQRNIFILQTCLTLFWHVLVSMLVYLQPKKRTRREMMHQKYEYIQNIHPRHCLMHQSDPSLLGTSCAQVMTRRHLCQKHRRWRPSVIEEVGKWSDKSSGLLGFPWQQKIRQKITSSSTESKCSRISTRF